MEGQFMDFPYRNVPSPLLFIYARACLPQAVTSQVTSALLTLGSTLWLPARSHKYPDGLTLATFPVIHIDGRIFTSGARTDPSPPD